MRTGIRKILYGLGLFAFAGTFFLSNEIPAYSAVYKLGEYFLWDSGLDFFYGQGEIEMAAELLGGQIYFHGETGDARLAVRENQVDREAREAVESGKEPIFGDIYSQSEEETQQPRTAAEQAAPVMSRNGSVYVEKLRSMQDTRYLWQKFYIVDSTTSVTKDLFNVKTLLNMDMTMPVKKGRKQILIYHTHGASEGFKDSRAGNIEDSVIGVGDELAAELEKRGYGVYHDRSRYDLIGGKLDRSLAYNKSLEGIQKIRGQEKDIEILIDLHRDSIGAGKHTYTILNGKKTAVVMFFNGMSRNRKGPIAYLPNPNLEGNLAFSLQLKCKAMECYDGFTKPIYLKGYRYNLHLEKKSLLIELGNENNTVEEAKNAAAPLAETIHKVLSGKG